MIKTIEIYDADGTIIDSTHRYRIGDNGKIDLEHWINNDIPEQIAKDKPLPLADQYRRSIANPDIYVIIATARVIKQADIDWIDKHIGLPDKIISRNGRDDNRKGAIMKLAGLRFLNQLKQFAELPKTFYEDNLDYLGPVCDSLNRCTGVYIPSKQGV